MTKIYEALENAGRGKAATARPGAIARSSVSKAMESILLSLFQRIDGAVETAGAKLVGLANAQPGNDSAVLLCEFAKLAALRLNKRVLVVAPGPSSHVNRIFSSTGPQGWESVVSGDLPVHEVVHRVGDALSVTQLTVSESALPAVISSASFKTQLERLRSDYDLVLFDAPSLSHPADLVMLAGVLDGVVIVVEAGKSRRPAVRYGVEQIAAQGGRVLGVVLNRRRFYIPAFLYQRL